MDDRFREFAGDDRFYAEISGTPSELDLLDRRTALFILIVRIMELGDTSNEIVCRPPIVQKTQGIDARLKDEESVLARGFYEFWDLAFQFYGKVL